MPPYDPVNVDLLKTPLPFFTCPSDANRPATIPAGGGVQVASTNYVGNGGPFNGSWQTDWALRATPIANIGSLLNGVIVNDGNIGFRDIVDGTSNTFVVGEAIHYGDTVGVNYQYPQLYAAWDNASGTACCEYTHARIGSRRLNPPPTASIQIKREAFASFHVGGAHFALCDGSVRFISENIDHSGRTHDWSAASLADLYDRANGGADFRTFQRLTARNDGYPLGEF